MSRRLLGGVCAAALAASGVSGAAAQEVLRVRAGEHPDYTRIVVDGPVGAEYGVGVDGDRLIVARAGAGGAFGLAPAQGAAGLTRIARFEPMDGGAFAALLACPCGVRTMRLGDGRFVIDVAEGAPRPPAPTVLQAAAETAPAPTESAAAPAEEAAAPLEGAVSAPRMAPPPPRAAAAPVEAAPSPAEAPGPAPAQSPDPVDAAEAPAAGDLTVDVAPSEPAAPAPARPLAAESPVPAPTETPTETAEAAVEEPAASPEPEPDESDAAAEKQDAEEGVNEKREQPSGEIIEDARRRLLQQLTRAAEEGFLTLAPGAEPPKSDGDQDEAESEKVDAKTALDLANPAPKPKPDERPAHCLPDSRLDASRWARESPADLQIGKGRRALVREFDEADGRAVLAYAQLLIRFGFGHEARAALGAFADAVAPPPYLLDMAAVVDGDAPAAEGPLRAGVGCDGLHGAWALAAAAIAGELDAAAIDLDALNDPFIKLPPLLRNMLAAPIAEAALAAGDAATAEHVVTLAARSNPPPPDGDARIAILGARVEAARGDWRRAEAAIEPYLAQASPAGAEAMIRLVEFRLARRAAPPPGLAENMEAMAFSLGASPLGRRLLAAAAGARAKGEGLALALDALRSLSQRGAAPGAAAAAAREMLVDYDPEPSESVAYVEAVLDHLDMIGEDADSDRARVAVARRFTTIGVTGLAEDVLAPPLSREDPAARIAAAQAALGDMAPDRALAHLEGMMGREAARMRAAAHAARRDYASAARAAGEAEDAALEARYAWLAGDWRVAAAAGDADRRVLAAWMAGEGEMPAELRAAAERDPALAARVDAFDTAADALPPEPLEAAAEALDAAKRRRALMRELIGDG